MSWDRKPHDRNEQSNRCRPLEYQSRTVLFDDRRHYLRAARRYSTPYVGQPFSSHPLPLEEIVRLESELSPNREMETPRTALSEKEKAAKWDDLLEKSARAGGTLHLGETGLMSDQLRYSVVSEV